MTKAPILAMPDFEQPFTLETDACDTGIGAVLMHNSKPIAFLSRALSVKNQGLLVYEKEFLALLMTVSKWRHHQQGPLLSKQIIKA